MKLSDVWDASATRSRRVSSVSWLIAAQLLSDTLPREQWPNLFLILVDPESPFDGEVTKELRRVTTPEGLRFLSCGRPSSLARRTARLTTDNLFDLLAGFAASDDGASGYQRELPVMALSDYAEFLEALLINGLTACERSRLCIPMDPATLNS